MLASLLVVGQVESQELGARQRLLVSGWREGRQGQESLSGQDRAGVEWEVGPTVVDVTSDVYV